MDNQYKGAKTDTKMLPFSELMQNKKLYWVVCAAIALIALMTVTALGRVFTNIPELIRGTFPKYLLLIPSLRFMPGYIVALLAAGLFSVMLAYKLHVNFRNLNIGHKGHAATLTREDIEARFL